ncbi:hypothetical protein CBS147326_8489 [Penicillium roqueforti]|nr:hypothetical protein CBS147326_8489 [Penicillium roqueforti]
MESSGNNTNEAFAFRLGSIDSSDLGTKANTIVIEDDPAPLGSQSNPVVIHVEEELSYFKTEQLNSDDDTEIIAESWWERFLDESCDTSSVGSIAGRSTSISASTHLPACKTLKDPEASRQSFANRLSLDEQALEIAGGCFHFEHGPSHEVGKGGNENQRRNEQVIALKAEKPAEVLSMLEAEVPGDLVGPKKRKSLHGEGSNVRPSDRLMKRAMH